MLRIRIEGSLFLQEGIYDTIDLRDARIGSSIDAARSVFTDDFRIDRARIDGKVNLVSLPHRAERVGHLYWRIAGVASSGRAPARRYDRRHR